SRADRDADARAHRELVPRGLDRPAERAADALGDLGSVAVVDEQRELVAADPRDEIVLSDDVPQSLGGGAEELVARAVTEAVVDRLEVVEVEVEKGQLLARGMRLVHHLLEARAVRQAGERIRERETLQLRQRLTLGRDVEQVSPPPPRPALRVADPRRLLAN